LTGETTPIIEVRLLGSPEVSIDGVAIDVDTRKAIAMLAFLTLERKVARERLATMFWGESSSDRARATLRRTLSALRTAIGPNVISADRHTVVLTDDSTWSDVEAFDREIGATADHGHDPADVCPACIPHLERATNLYRGDFLEGFSLRDSPEFEDWVRLVAETERLRAGETFNRLAMAIVAAGDYPGGIAAATRWVDLDTLHEPAHRLLMLLHAWAGDRPGAVEAYRTCVAVLDHELGVPPLEETTELYEAILDEDLPPAPGVRRRVKTAMRQQVTPATSLIGRETELGTLREVLDSVSHQGQFVSIVGHPWMGKTRLLEELATEAETRGMGVVFGRAFRMEQGLPYGVATQMLRRALPRIQAAASNIPEWALSEVSRLIPELGPTPEETSDRFGDMRLYEAVHSVLGSVAGSQGLALIIDDIQWMDPASADLVSYVTRRIGELPILVAAGRTAGESTTETVTDLLLTAGTVIELEPLRTNDLIEIAGDVDGADRLHQITGGIPVLVLESLTTTIDNNGKPGVARYAEGRISQLGALARQVLAAASVLDGVCDANLLRVTSGRSDEEVVDAVEELVGAGLLREVPDTDGLGFTLDAIEKIVYDSTSLIRRRLLHGRAARALAERPRARVDARLAAMVATHHQSAGDSDAAEWFQRAGDLARAVYANTEALEMYETAVALGGVDGTALRLSLGELAMIKGDYEVALRHLTTARASAADADIPLIEHRLGEVQRLLGRFMLAEEHFEAALAGHPQPAEVYADWALLSHRVGQTSRALELAALGLSAAEESGDTRQQSRVRNILGVVSPDPQTAIGHLEEAIMFAGDDDLLRMAALNNHALLLANEGDDTRASGLIEEAIEIAVRTGHRHREAALHNHLADLHHRAGRESDAQESLKRAVALFADVGSGDLEPEVWLLSQW